MGSALALSGESLWGREFTHLHDEEFFGACASCGDELYLTIGAAGCFVSKEDPVRSKGDHAEIVPCASRSLSGFRTWLHRTAVDVGDAELANRILCVFGRSTCPVCLAGLDIAKAIEQS